jgi:hypothetical protein
LWLLSQSVALTGRREFQKSDFFIDTPARIADPLGRKWAIPFIPVDF